MILVSDPNNSSHLLLSLYNLCRSPGEWGGHQELYAASQSMRVNIIVHQCSTTAPRFILSCENAVRDINLSYHGECHYNSVHHLINEGDYQDVSKIKASILSAEVTASKQPNLVLETAVKRALPWTTCDHQVQLALKLSNNDVDAAVELLMMNPDGLDDIADSCNVEVVSAHGRLADIENEIINFPSDELGNRPPGHIDDDKPVLRNSKSLKGTRLSARSSDASLPVKLIRRKEILKIKSSAVNVSLSKKVCIRIFDSFLNFLLDVTSQKILLIFCRNKGRVKRIQISWIMILLNLFQAL